MLYSKILVTLLSSLTTWSIWDIEPSHTVYVIISPDILNVCQEKHDWLCPKIHLYEFRSQINETYLITSSASSGITVAMISHHLRDPVALRFSCYLLLARVGKCCSVCQPDWSLSTDFNARSFSQEISPTSWPLFLGILCEISTSIGWIFNIERCRRFMTLLSSDFPICATVRFLRQFWNLSRTAGCFTVTFGSNIHDFLSTWTVITSLLLFLYFFILHHH